MARRNSQATENWVRHNRTSTRELPPSNHNKRQAAHTSNAHISDQDSPDPENLSLRPRPSNKRPRCEQPSHRPDDEPRTQGTSTRELPPSDRDKRQAVHTSDAHISDQDSPDPENLSLLPRPSNKRPRREQPSHRPDDEPRTQRYTDVSHAHLGCEGAKSPGQRESDIRVNEATFQSISHYPGELCISPSPSV